MLKTKLIKNLRISKAISRFKKVKESYETLCDKPIRIECNEVELIQQLQDERRRTLDLQVITLSQFLNHTQ